MRSVSLAFVCALAVGCFDRPKPECAFLCGADDACPDDYSCRPDGWCKLGGVSDDFDCDPVGGADAAANVDGGTADAADLDAPVADAADLDAPLADAMPADAMPPDAEPADAMPPDAMPPDAMPGNCTSYCTAFEANCTGGNDEYDDQADCEAYCGTYAMLPLGIDGETSGNSVACREHHAGLASGDPGTHCPHAGKTGGDTCGTWCENYCHLAMTNCTGGNQITFTTDCMTDCMAFATSGSPGDAAGDTVQCRIEYLGLAGEADTATNCMNGSPSSTTCQ